jgi:hypothetical protein
MVNHKIPHRFIRSSTMGVHWCAHCGKMVALGKETHMKCSECSVIAHEHCADRIPDFCGLPDGLIDHILKNPPGRLVKTIESSNSLEMLAAEKVGPRPELYNRAINSSDGTEKSDSSPLSRPVSDKRKARGESLAYFRHGTKGVGLDDFTFLAVLGKGNFGKVMLAQEKFTNNYYGIKVLKKEFILEHDEVERYYFYWG